MTKCVFLKFESIVECTGTQQKKSQNFLLARTFQLNVGLLALPWILWFRFIIEYSSLRGFGP
jgi:hypothetical protein